MSFDIFIYISKENTPSTSSVQFSSTYIVKEPNIEKEPLKP